MSTKNEYMLLFSSNEWYNELSQSELQTLMAQAKLWFDGIMAKGQAKGGQALARQGATVSGKNARVISDGPFAESKEAVAGFFVVQAESLDAAAEIAKGCPGLEYGQTVEVRAFAVDAFENEKARVKAGQGDSGF